MRSRLWRDESRRMEKPSPHYHAGAANLGGAVLERVPACEMKDSVSGQGRVITSRELSSLKIEETVCMYLTQKS